MAISFIGGGTCSTRRKPPSTYKLYYIMLYQVNLTWTGFEFTTLVVIGTDCIGSCKSNYHTITTTTSPSLPGEWYMLIWTSSFIILFSVEINFSWTKIRSIYTSLPDVLYFQLQQAHRVFYQFARGPATEKYLHQLDEACEKFWKNGRQLCEEISVTGNHCIKPVCNISRTFCFTFLFRKYKIKWLCNLHEENIG